MEWSTSNMSCRTWDEHRAQNRHLSSAYILDCTEGHRPPGGETATAMASIAVVLEIKHFDFKLFANAEVSSFNFIGKIRSRNGHSLYRTVLER
jgi:hypothetical protein